MITDVERDYLKKLSMRNTYWASFKESVAISDLATLIPEFIMKRGRGEDLLPEEFNTIMYCMKMCQINLEYDEAEVKYLNEQIRLGIDEGKKQ